MIHASGGAIELGEGVIIGAGVLLVGNVVIGDRACIGSGTTVMNRAIERLLIVPPGSLMVSENNKPDAVEDPELIEDVWQANGAKPQVDVQSNESKPPVEQQESDEIESPAS